VTEDQKKLILTSFDPVKGRGPELARIAQDPNDWSFGALSPDGTRIALRDRYGRIKILSLHGELVREIQVKDSRGDVNPSWAHDGKALFVTAVSCADPSNCVGGGTILRLALDGEAQPVLEHGSNIGSVASSPDGRHMAIVLQGGNRNVWMMENF
jgi:hypothetical protein